MYALWNTLQPLEQRLGQRHFGDQLAPEIRQLFFGRQPVIPEQENNFLIGCFYGQIIDVVACIIELPICTVHISYSCFSRNDSFETSHGNTGFFFGHRTHLPLASIPAGFNFCRGPET